MKKALTIYEGVNECVLSLVPMSADRILDVGCGSGVLGERIRQLRERIVVGITYSQQEAEMASGRLSEVICAELNQFDFRPLGQFDCVILSHILEHLYCPEELLERLRSALGRDSTIVVALPNVVWWRQRLQFLLGKWRYQDSGILDRTHFRFYDMQSSKELLEQAGFEIILVKRDGPFPLIRPIRKWANPVAKMIDRCACKVAPGLFAFQFVYLAKLRI